MNLASLKYAFTLALAGGALLSVIGCGHTPEVAPQVPEDTGYVSSGRLVIIGGGLKRENETVYKRIIDAAGPGGRIGVLPTASGVPEETGPDYLKDFQTYGAADRSDLIDVTLNNPEAADTPEVAADIASRSGVFFTGGDQSRITEAFLPEGRAASGYVALLSVLAKGGVISGTSAGAAMMSDPMIKWGNSEEALLIGDPDAPDRGVGLADGMGFFPYGVTDQHFLARGRLGRLVAALEIADVDFGFGVDENKALDVDLGAHQVGFIGDQAALFVDLSRMERDGFSRRNVRVSLLGGGDLVNGETGKITPDPMKTMMTEPLVWTKNIPVNSPAWDDFVVRDAIVDLATHGAARSMSASENFQLVFTEDGDTSFSFSDPEDFSTISAYNVRLDIFAKKEAEGAAADLRAEIRRGESEK